MTLKMSNEKIGTILDTISKQTALEFAYSGQFIDIERRINVEVKNAATLSGIKTDVYRIKHEIIPTKQHHIYSS